MIASVSGIRGIPNEDMSLEDFARFADGFARLSGSDSFLLARDTRATGDAIRKGVLGALLSAGAEVRDYGVVSTPALFRESLVKKKPAIMITASHNEPQFNGLKFIRDGLGLGEGDMRTVVKSAGFRREEFKVGRVRRGKASYNDDLVRRFGEGSLEGVKVALDLGGGAATSHAVPVLRRLGCEVVATNDSPGVFNRVVDPTRDELKVLLAMTRGDGCDIGLGFDCDGDRLVIVDSKGRKRTGDHMLGLATSMALRDSPGKDVVVSVDTTSAIEEVVARVHGRVYRSKVGEANVVGEMIEKGIGLGGEGSSGGLIDGSFNYCRDSMLAALLIIRGIREQGEKFYDSVKAYQQARAAIPMARKKATKAMSMLIKRHGDADTTDGVKVTLSRSSWVLVRHSNTEEAVRVSAEAGTLRAAERIVAEFSAELQELGR